MFMCATPGHTDKSASPGAVCSRCGQPLVPLGIGKPIPTAAPQAAPRAAPPARGSMPSLRPMLATEVPNERLMAAIKDPRWVIEQKIDGHRVLLEVVNGRAKAIGRNGQSSQHNALFMQSAYKTDLSAIPTSCILDGELVDGVLWVFDLPYLADKAGPIDPSHILSVRRAALEEMFTWWTPNPACFRLLPVAHLDLDKSKLALTVLQNGGEGLMLKDTMGTYRSGARVKDVCKVKFVKTIDCVVTAVGTQGKENYSLGVYRPTNAPGAMSNGRFELVEVGRCSAIGKAKVNVGDVIEVKYLYLGADNRLYQPRMMRPRTDKGALECTIDQLDHAKVNKTVVERWSA